MKAVRDSEAYGLMEWEASCAPSTARGPTTAAELLYQAIRRKSMAELPPLDDAALPGGSARALCPLSTGCACMYWKPFAPRGRPCVLLLHGLPEWPSWRKIMLPLAAAGFHVLAPISADTAARRAGVRITTAICIVQHLERGPRRIGAGRRRSANARSQRSSAMILAHRSPPGARWRGRTSSLGRIDERAVRRPA